MRQRPMSNQRFHSFFRKPRTYVSLMPIEARSRPPMRRTRKTPLSRETQKLPLLKIQVLHAHLPQQEVPPLGLCSLGSWQ